MPDRFHFSPHEQYGILGWFETVIKAFGGACAAAALSTIQVGVDATPQRFGGRIGEIVLVAMFTAWFIFATVHRFMEGELFAILFVLFQLLTTPLLLVATILAPDPGGWIFAFALLMTLGEVTHLFFLLLRPDFEQVWLDKLKLRLVTLLLLAMGVVLLALQIIVWITTYSGDIGAK